MDSPERYKGVYGVIWTTHKIIWGHMGLYGQSIGVYGVIWGLMAADHQEHVLYGIIWTSHRIIWGYMDIP